MHRYLVIALLGATMALTGCGGDDGESGGGSQDQAATPEATAEAEAEQTATATATATAEEEADDAAAEGALAEQKGLKARGARETTVDIAVTGLEVDGELATLSLVYTMHAPDEPPDTSYSLYDLNGQDPLYVTLVDPVNLKRYNVVEDSEGQALQTGAVETDVPLDASATAQYTFAAPPPDVTEIDVSVGDWPTFRDIPITR
jgi:uncharacterized protein (DUF2147 family)